MNYIEEYVSCAKSPVYFANTYGYVFDMEKQQMGKMTCFPYQEDCLNQFNDSQNSIVLKSRQMGLSVISALYVAWRLTFCPDERILVVADSGNGAVRFLNTVKQFLDRLPDWMLPEETLINKNMLTRRMTGLVSYYKSEDDKSYPTLRETEIINVPMSDYQFAMYQFAREKERNSDKKVARAKKKSGAKNSENFSKSVFRIFCVLGRIARKWNHQYDGSAARDGTRVRYR